MSFLEFASRLFPYWCLGAFTFYAVWKSEYKNILSFNLGTFSKFFLFMACISAFRYFVLSEAFKHGIGLEQAQSSFTLPIGGTAFVGWEDMCHSVPLVVLRKMWPSKWATPIHVLLLLAVMLSFGLGHVYQGGWSALLIAFYIPYAVGFIERNGAGTLMAGHVLYDFCTIMTVRLAAGHV
jgi:hypothetical protein